MCIVTKNDCRVFRYDYNANSQTKIPYVNRETMFVLAYLRFMAKKSKRMAFFKWDSVVERNTTRLYVVADIKRNISYLICSTETSLFKTIPISPPLSRYVSSCASEQTDICIHGHTTNCTTLTEWVNEYWHKFLIDDSTYIKREMYIYMYIVHTQARACT